MLKITNKEIKMPYTSDSHEFKQLSDKNPKAKKILAEGDSWFAYPRRFFLFGPASNVVDYLAKRKKYLIYSTSSNGDEALSMMSGEQKNSMMKRIKANYYDFLLFSGGGNDMVGRFDFDYFVEEKLPSMQALDCINWTRFNRKLTQISSVYEELIDRVLQYSSNTNIKIITHTYDYVIPTKKGFELFDIFPIGESWMHPILIERKITDPDEQQLIAKTMLTAFKNTLLKLQVKYNKIFYVVDTQGLLSKKQWRNELHPTPGGFRLVSKKIAQTIDALS